MYAVVITGGKQYRVSEGTTLVVDRIASEVGTELSLDKVLLIGGENTVVGAPTVPGAVVKATVVAHAKGAKTESMKYTHRQRRRTQRNGRASLSVLKIDSITA